MRASTLTSALKPTVRRERISKSGGFLGIRRELVVASTCRKDFPGIANDLQTQRAVGGAQHPSVQNIDNNGNL